MSKQLFAIALAEPNNEIGERLVSAYPTNFQYTDTFYLVAVDPVTLTKDIAERVGLKGANRIEDSSGVVFTLNTAYSGFTNPSLWEWLKAIKESQE